MSAIQELIAQRRAPKVSGSYQSHWMVLQGQLSKARRAAKLTQQQMAERLDISRETFQRWEQERGVPDALQLFRWADVLGITIRSEMRESGKTAARSAA